MCEEEGGSKWAHPDGLSPERNRRCLQRGYRGANVFYSVQLFFGLDYNPVFGTSFASIWRDKRVPAEAEHSTCRME